MKTRFALLVLVAALGGCATTDASQPVTAPPPSVVSSSAAPVPSPSQLSLRGTVANGVEPGCVLLNAEDRTTYLLIGGDKAVLTAGRTVTVWGSPAPDTMSACMQGTPFRVTRVEG